MYIHEFHRRVNEWVLSCFGEKISKDKDERNHRFLEESLELVQACGMTKIECIQLVEYVFNRPIGNIQQEVGGTITTLAALCTPNNIDLESAALLELKRVWKKIEIIREKQKNKPKNSPLPI